MNLFTRRKKDWLTLVNFNQTTDVRNIQERQEEKLVFLGIDEMTLHHVREASESLRPFKEEIVNMFYKNVTSVDHLNKLIEQHTEVSRLKKTLAEYVESFFRAEINQSYVENRIKVGRVHSAVGLTVDHFISAHHLLLQMMTSILLENVTNKHKLADYIIAIQKLSSFDQQLISEVYMEDTFKHFLFGISDLINHATQLDTTRQLIERMEEQKEETTNVTAATDEMSASIQEVANHATKVSEGTEDAVSSALHSKKVVDDALNSIREVGSVYEAVVKKVKRLEEEIEHTKYVVKVITDIADQTNLLALNASIEAARAGEQGKGFVVVASEVRKLSENTKEQITQITNNMNALQQVSEEVTTEITRTGQLVEKSVNGAEFAGNALSQIIETMTGINEETSQIAAMSEEQTSAVIDIADRNSFINELSIETQKIAKETAKMILELSKKMEEYRNTFFATNIKMQSRDIVRLTITDHLLWKWRVYNMILGLETIDEVPSHKQCRLGKWYYGDVPKDILSIPLFKQIEAPHIEVHESALRAVEYYKKGDIESTQMELERLEKASQEVMALLQQLEKSI